MAVARDVAIIVLAVESIIIGALLVFLIIQIQRLVKMLREEIKPILDSTNETASTVRGTATFVSHHLIAPMVQLSSFFSGLRRGSQMLTRWPTRSRASAGGDEAAPASSDQSASGDAL